MENESNEDEIRGMKDFDPSIAANIAGKNQIDLAVDIVNAGKNVYDPIKDQIVPVDSLPFGGNEGKIILEKGDESGVRRARNSGVPLSTLEEYEKAIPEEEFPEDTEMEDDEGEE